MSYPVNRRTVPHLRCGVCDEPIAQDEPTRYIDDERCHRECGGDIEIAGQCCPDCFSVLGEMELTDGYCNACGERLS